MRKFAFIIINIIIITITIVITTNIIVAIITLFIVLSSGFNVNIEYLLLFFFPFLCSVEVTHEKLWEYLSFSLNKFFRK